jgi:hypothetical protein
VWLGVRWAQGNLPIEAFAKRAVIPAGVIASVCLGLRWALSRGAELGASEFLFDKWHLGPVRLLDFAAVAMLCVLSQSVWKLLAIGPLVLMGQSSLQVFCVHLLFCFAGLTLMGHASMLNGWRQFALLSLTFAAMLATAKVFSKSEAKHERQPKTGISPVSHAQTHGSSAPESGSATGHLSG